MTVYTHIEELRSNAKKWGLEADDHFWKTPIEELAKIYNGCGPDWLPAWVRKILTYIFVYFEEAFLIHDYDCVKMEKTEKNFINWNNRLERNCKTIAVMRWNWWRIATRWKYYGRAKIVAEACRKWGRSAFFGD